MAKAKKINPGKASKKKRPELSVLRRIIEGIEEDENECWIWTKYTDSQGYGQIRISGRSLWIHRVTYTIFKRSISAGDEIDHICCNPSCCNPDHLRRSSMSENRSRASRPSAPVDDIPI